MNAQPIHQTSNQTVQQNAQHTSQPNVKPTGTANTESLIPVHQIPSRQVVNKKFNQPVHQTHSGLVHQMLNCRPVHQTYINHYRECTADQYIERPTDQRQTQKQCLTIRDGSFKF